MKTDLEVVLGQWMLIAYLIYNSKLKITKQVMVNSYVIKIGLHVSQSVVQMFVCIQDLKETQILSDYVLGDHHSLVGEMSCESMVMDVSAMY